MKVVVTEPLMIATEVVDSLNSLGDVTYGPFTDAELLGLLPGCEVLMVRLGRYIGPEILRHAPNLRYIVSATTGLDHIDRDAASSAGITVICLRDCMTEIQDVSATAEHTWGLLLSLIRTTPSAVAHVKAGGWDRDQFWGTQLNGKELGIIGHGRIGGMVARYGAAFGMTVTAYDADPANVLTPASYVSLKELFQRSDVISLHITADQRNRQLIDRSLIAQAKPGAYFLNTSRGMLADSAALAEAVDSGRLAGVGVDVLDGEEHNAIDEDPLLVCARSGKNVLITPHIGGATRESIAQTESAVVTELMNRLKNTKAVNPVTG